MREHLTGQFTPGTSILHRLDARAKFFGFLILIAATVCTDAWLGYALSNITLLALNMRDGRRLSRSLQRARA